MIQELSIFSIIIEKHDKYLYNYGLSFVVNSEINEYV